jgi:hypothetical protein
VGRVTRAKREYTTSHGKRERETVKVTSISNRQKAYGEGPVCRQSA